jgi:hypothetical protein
MSTETVRGLETYAALVCSRLVSLRFCHSLAFLLQIRNYRVGVASSGMTTGQLFARTTHRESKQANKQLQTGWPKDTVTLQCQTCNCSVHWGVEVEQSALTLLRCCVITVHTICIMGTSQVFTNKYTFFFKKKFWNTYRDKRHVSYLRCFGFKTRSHIGYPHSLQANAGAVSLIRPALLASSIFLI